MVIQNNTSIQIECRTEDGRSISVLPKSELCIDLDEAGSVLEIGHVYKSSCKRLFDVDSVYHMVIDSRIDVRNVAPDALIVVSGETVHFYFGYVYDKFFFSVQNCKIISENCWVSNLNSLKESAYEPKRKDSTFERITTFLLSGGFWLSTGLFALFKLAFWTNGWAFPIWSIVLFWVTGYVIQLIGEKTAYKYLSKKQPRQSELTKYASEESIMAYFENPSREWIGDDRITL